MKYCAAFSCFFAAAFVLNVPRFRRLPVFGFFLREYTRYLPDFSFLIMSPSNIRRPSGPRAPTKKSSGPLMSNLSASRTLKKKREQRGENCEIGQQVSREAPVLAGVTETAAGNVEAAHFCGDGGEREDQDQRG